MSLEVAVLVVCTLAGVLAVLMAVAGDDPTPRRAVVRSRTS